MAVDLDAVAEEIFHRTGRHPTTAELILAREAIANLEHPEEP